MVLIIVLVIQTISALKCTKFQNDTIEIYATPNESIIINYDDIFKINDYTKVEIDDLYQVISNIKPIQLLQEQEYNFSQFIAFVQLKEAFSEDWQNKFAMLKKNGIQYEIELSVNSYQRIPNFNQKSTNISADVCFDLAFFSSTLIGVDCMLVEQNDGIQNIFFIWDVNSESFISIENANPAGYTETIKRKLESSNQDIYRVSLYDPKYPQFDSLLEVFAKNGSIIHQLNSSILENLISKDYQLQIIDFVVSRMGQVAILNNNGDILIMNYNRKDQVWVLLHKFNHEGAQQFDFDFKRNSYALISNDTLIYQSLQNLYTYNLDFKADKIHITKDSIIVEFDKQLIYQFDLELQLIYQIDIQDKFIQLITDQTQNDLLFIKQTKFQRFQINPSYSLQFLSHEVNYDRQSSQIIQNLPDKSICKLIIFHTTVDFNNEAIYISDLSETIISQYITTYPFQQNLNLNNLKLYGPNIELHFGEIKNDKINIKFQVQKHSEIHLQQKYTTQIPNFIKIANSENKNYIVKQYNQTNTIISICQIDYNLCIDNDGIFEIQELNQSSSIIWTASNGIFFGDAYNQSFQIHFFQESQKFTTYGESLSETISSIGFNGEVLIILSGKNIYCYYISSIDSFLLYTLTTEIFIQMGIKDWDPNEIITHPKSNDLFIINKNRTQLIIMECKQTGYRVIDIFNYDQFQIKKILIFEGSFGIEFQNEIQFYNRKQETNIFKIKILPIFGHKNYQLIDSSYEGFVYIKSDKILLVYNVNKININSLYCSLEINDNQIFSVFQNYLLLNETRLINIYKDIQIISQIRAGDINFIENYTLVTSVKNNNQDVIINSPIYVQNSYTSLFLEEDNLNIIHTFDKKKQDNLWQVISNDWIKGTIIDINMNCTHCGQAIKLIKYIQKDSITIYTDLDFMDMNDQYMIVLHSDGFETIDKFNYTISKQYQLSPFIGCKQIVFVSENRLIFRCLNFYNKLSLISFQKFESQYIEDQDQLLINQNLIELYIQNNKTLILIEKQQIEFLDCEIENFTFSQCKSIYIQQIEEQYLTFYNFQDNIYLFTYSNELIITIFDSQNLQIKKQEYIDIEQIIYQSGYFIQNNNWIDMKIINNQDNNINFILFSKNSIHYQFQLKQNDNNINISIINTLQNYGDWLSINVKQKQKWIAIEYQKIDDKVILLYNINNNNSIITGIGGINYDLNNNNIKFDFIQEYNNSDKINLLSTLDSKNVNKYQLNDQLQLYIDGKIDTQQVQFTIMNDFDQIDQSIKFEINYYNYKFWGIWLLIGIIVISCIIAIVWWRKRKAKKAKKVYLLE